MGGGGALSLGGNFQRKHIDEVYLFSEKTYRPCDKYKLLSLSTDGNLLGGHITTKLERHICRDKARQNPTGTKQV